MPRKKTEPETKTEEIKKPDEEKQKKEEMRRVLMERQFLNLEDMARLSGRKPEEIENLVKAGVITGPSCFCYPADFGDGKQIAFFPKKTLEAIENAQEKF